MPCVAAKKYLNCDIRCEFKPAQERRLGWGEKIGLEPHMMLCDGCTNFRKQLDFVRAAIRHYLDGGSAR